ncbi:hypothetical protein Golob_009858 [Gossypium lobatum]|uniref:peroxidase n=1 Tax=Gossypium lobatum TaxID=34289 RepID=A0A7J8MK24_9ROSI|nr:hypothetical protein [Gossypium lobatum]
MDIFISSAFGYSQKKKEEKEMKISAAVVAAFSLAFSFILVNFTGQCDAALQQGFYKGKCNSQDVEAIVASVVKRRFNDKPRVAAGLIRLFFHDCFVNGCDASILLDGDSSEKTAPPNLSVSGYDVIDEAKGLLEEACAGVVSCADIIAIAARDAVQLSGGVRYEVQTGRRDGSVSLASNVDLPSPRFSVSQSADAFAKKGIGLTDMVLLLGGHTIGFTNCSLFRDRLYNFDNTGKPDPTMDPLLVMKLRLICPRNSPADRTPVSLDQNLASTFIVDNSFYKQIRLGRGILQIDQALALDPLTNNTVASLANGNDFLARFGQAMVKLGAVDPQMVLSGDADITSDFLVPQDVNNADGNFFTFTGTRVLVGEDFPTKFTILKASMAEFPALNGHSVSYVVLQFPAVSTNPPHTHPRPPSSFSLSPEAWNPVSWTQPTSFSRSRYKLVTCSSSPRD